MKTVSGFPYFEVQFTKDGDVNDNAEVSALRDFLKTPSNATDMLVMSHGWNNDMNDARQLYAKFLGCVRTVLDGKAVPGMAGRTFAVLAVLWPSMKFADEDLIPSGAAAIGSVAPAELVKKQLDRLEEALGPSATNKKAFARARALVPALPGHPKAREEFADLVRSVLPGRAGEVDDASKAFFGRKGGDLMDRLSAPVAAPVARPGRGGAASIGLATGGIDDALSGVWSGARNLLNYSTYYLMKERAGTVGRGGVNGVLRDLKKARPDLRVHLAGHSFGGRLVTAAADGPSGKPVVPIDTMTLLQAAFSQNGFAVKFDGTRNGAFRAVVSAHKVGGPIVITHSRNDKAVGLAYPIASRIAGQDAAAIGDANDRFGGMGANGAQHTPESVEGPLEAVGVTYTFEKGKVYNLNADAIIEDHSDICHNEVAFALLEAVAVS